MAENPTLAVAAAATAAVVSERPVDSSYIREWRKFKDFVKERRAANQLPGEQNSRPFLTRENVDLYFQVVVANWGTVQPRTAQRVVAALRSMAIRMRTCQESS